MKRAGHQVVLVAPLRAASALLGPGLSAVDELVDWDSPTLVPLFSGRTPADSKVRPRLASADAAIAYTADPALSSTLAGLVPRVIVHAPSPVEGHASRFLARPVAALGADPRPDPPSLEPTPEEDDRATAFLRDQLPPGFLAIHPGSGSAAKNWPPEHFAVVADAISPGTPWLLVEGPADGPAAAILSAAPGAIRARDLPLRVLGAVLARSGLYIGNDSGVTHLAAASGAPTLALFGPTEPATWAPVGERTAVASSATAAMADLDITAVVAAAQRLADSARSR